MTVPFEGFDYTHPDHADWVALAGQCFADHHHDRWLLGEGICPRSNRRIMPDGILRPSCSFCDCGEDPPLNPPETT